MINANDPAMPVNYVVGESGKIYNSQDDGLSGLTKREHFAAMAMQGLYTSYGQHDLTDSTDFAHDAVMIADALINELNKPKQ